jgi:hypothetical protein
VIRKMDLCGSATANPECGCCTQIATSLPVPGFVTSRIAPVFT